MSSFAETVSQAICEYKKILKRKLPQQNYTAKLRDLGIKRTQLKKLDEANLFDVANKILQELESNYSNTVYSGLYSGIHEFIGYFKNIISHHRIEDNKVVNTTQKASAALVEAAQILSLSKSKINSRNIERLEYCIDGIIQYGTFTQVSMVISAIKKRGLEKVDECEAIVDKLEQHLNSFTAGTEIVSE